MKIGIFKLLGGDIEVVDLDEDAPLIKVQFYNEASKIPHELRYDLVKQMVDCERPKLWLIGAIWAGVGLITGWAGHALVAFLRAM